MRRRLTALAVAEAAALGLDKQGRLTLEALEARRVQLLQASPARGAVELTLVSDNKQSLAAAVAAVPSRRQEMAKPGAEVSLDPEAERAEAG